MRKILAALVASGALAAGAAASAAITSAPAIAQESTPTPEESQSSGQGSVDPRECNHGFAALVEDGTLTQAQADAIAEALRAARESGRLPVPGGGDREAKAAAMREVLADLVSDGTITQAQADAVIAAKGRHRPMRGSSGDSGSNTSFGRFVQPLPAA